jgi:L-asparaginase II
MYLRSTAKVFQILPLLYYGIDKKYDLSLKEIAIMVSSQVGTFEHLEVIRGIMDKTGIIEDDFCTKPCYPTDFKTTEAMIAQGTKPSSIYNMCSGKHLGLMLIEKEFGERYQDYYLESSQTTKLGIEFTARLAEFPKEKVVIGLDGCGVPVFGIPLYNSAVAFKNMTFTNYEDEKLNHAIQVISEAISAYPDIVRGKDYFCSYHNYDKNVIGKDGAHGFYAFGLKKEHLGIAFKLFSGDMNMFPYVANRIYEKINYSNELLLPHINFKFLNDNGQVIGEYISDF